MTADAFLSWLLEASLTASLLVLLVLFLRRPVRRAFGARAAMLLWLAPGLRLVCPPLGTGLLPRLGGDPAALPAQAPVLTYGPVPTTLPTPPVTTQAETLPVGSALSAPPEAALDLSLLAVAVWLTGAGVAFALALLRTHAWRRTLLREASAPSAALSALASRTAKTAGVRTPLLVLSGAAASPQVTGLFRPLVALPQDFERRFSPGEQHLALLHEMTHLRRHDLLQGWLAEGLCALHWFNPFARAALPRLRTDQEAACDEAVRAKGVAAQDYAGTLLRAASGPAVPALTLNHALKERIETMRLPLPKTTTRLLGTCALFAFGVGAAAAAQTAVQDAPGSEGAPPAAEEAQSEARETARGVGISRSNDNGRRSVTVHAGGENIVTAGSDAEMILLSDPFAELMPPPPAPPENPEPPRTHMRPPVPPVPPAPRVQTRETEEGTWILIPDTKDAEFEVEMEAYEEEMEAWGEAFEESMGGWEEEMEAFGERMGDWGEKMGRIGEAVGELGRACEEHRDETARPAVLTADVEDTGETIRAVCARGGGDRYASDELTRFVERHRDLSEAEKDAYFEQLDGNGYVMMTR